MYVSFTEFYFYQIKLPVTIMYETKNYYFFFYMYLFCLHVCVGMVNLSYSKMLHIFPY